MQSATANVAEYFDKRWKSYEQEVKASDSRRAECRKAAEQHAEAMKSLQRDITIKEALKKEASANGLDTTPLDKEIIRIRQELEALQKLHNEQHQRATQPGPVVPYERGVVTRFVRHLGEQKHNGAELLPSLQAAASRITVSLSDLTLDKDGLVTKAQVRFARHRIGELPISPENARYVKAFRPDPLRWLPSLAGEPTAVEEMGHHHEPMRAFIVEDRHALLLPAEFVFQYEEWPGARPQAMHVTGDIAPFVLASNILANALKTTGGAIRLDETYADQFLARIRDEIVGLTIEEPRWKKNTEFPDSDHVLSSIKNDLALLAAAPWSDDLGGLWAKFKHTLENGERPRMWRKEHVDHYGLRLRTRDHTWLVGCLFIDRTQQTGKPGDPIQITHDANTRRVGRLHVVLSEVRDEQRGY